MTTLAYLNELREARGMKPLKAWKESKQKMLDAIAKLAPDATPGEVPSPDQSLPIVAQVAKHVAKSVDIKNLTPESAPEAKANADSWEKENGGPVKTPKPKKEKPAKRDKAESFSISDLAKKYGKQVKVLRNKCRRHRSKLQPLTIDPSKEEWLWDNTNSARVLEILGLSQTTGG